MRPYEGRKDGSNGWATAQYASARLHVLKATLHNCVRLGPGSQNRAGEPDFRAHLLGRVAWAAQLNPARGAKLRGLFERIVW